MNKKGLAQYLVFLIFVVAILVFFYLNGIFGGALLKNSLSKIPVWFWIVIGFIVLISISGGRKK